MFACRSDASYAKREPSAAKLTRMTDEAGVVSGSGIAEHAPGLLVDANAPDVRAAAAIAAEEQISSVARPDGAPVDERVRQSPAWPRLRSGPRQDVSPGGRREDPSTPAAVRRRPRRLHHVVLGTQFASMARRDVDDRCAAGTGTVVRRRNLGRVGDFLAVGRPGRAEAHVRQVPLARRPSPP